MEWFERGIPLGGTVVKRSCFVIGLLVLGGCCADGSPQGGNWTGDRDLMRTEIWADSMGRISGVVDTATDCPTKLAEIARTKHPGWNFTCESAPGCGPGSWRVTYTRAGFRPFTEYYDRNNQREGCTSIPIHPSPQIQNARSDKGYPKILEIEQMQHGDTPDGPWHPVDKYVARVVDKAHHVWRIVFTAVVEGDKAKISILAKYVEVPATVLIPRD